MGTPGTRRRRASFASAALALPLLFSGWASPGLAEEPVRLHLAPSAGTAQGSQASAVAAPEALESQARARSSSAHSRTVAPKTAVAALAAGAVASNNRAHAAPARRTDLAGVTNLTGSRTAFVDVRVPRIARLGEPLAPSRAGSVRVQGGGRFAGFALVRAGLPKDGPVLVGGRFGFLDRQGFRPGAALVASLAGPQDGLDFILPPGNYRLYLLADGKPAKVTLRLSGLSGTATIAPTRPAPLVVQGGTSPLDPQAPVGLRNVYADGGDLRINRPTINFTTFGMRHDVHTESTYTTCIHTQKPAGPSPYAPGCPTLGGGTSVLFPQVISDEYVEPNQLRAAWGGLLATGGHLGVGGNLITATPAEDAAYGQVWLGL